MKIDPFRQRMVAAFVVFLLPQLLVAQEPPRSQYEHVKGLEPFIGFWASDANDSQEGRLAVSCRWTGNKSYAQFNVWVRNDDERTNLGTINIGWDGAAKKLAMWAFFPDGQASAFPSIEGGTLKWSSEGTSADGEKTSADVTFEVDGEKLSIQVRNSHRGDVAQPDMNLSFARQARRQR